MKYWRVVDENGYCWTLSREGSEYYIVIDGDDSDDGGYYGTLEEVLEFAGILTPMNVTGEIKHG